LEQTRRSFNINKGNNQEEITIVNMYAPNVYAPNFLKQNYCLTSSRITVVDSNIPFLPVDKSSRQKTNKETSNINDSLDQMDSTDFYRVLHPAAA
jgi:hypothetical protein